MSARTAMFLYRVITLVIATILAVGGNYEACTSCTTPGFQRENTSSNSSQLTSNVSRVICNLLNNYDKMMRPGLGGPPCKIKVNIYIVSFAPINEADMEYSPTFYLRQYWNDKRLSYGDALPSKSIRLSGDFISSIWTPETYFENDLTDNVKRETAMIEISSEGNIRYSSRRRVRSNCPMNFTRFPFDRQTCRLTFGSFSYDDKELIYEWMTELSPLEFSPHLKMSHYYLVDWHTESRVETYITGHYAAVTARFEFEREVRFYILQAFIPTGLIVILSWVGFWIDERSVPARVSLGITTVLAITTLIFGVQSSFPRVGYIKAIDVYLLGSFLFVFGSLVEYAIICSMTKSDERKLHEHEDSQRRAKSDIGQHWWEKDEATENVNKVHVNGEQSATALQSKPKATTSAATGDKLPAQSYWFDVGKLHLRKQKPKNYYLPRYLRGSKYHVMDRVSRVAFPSCYFILLVVYFVGYIHL